MTVLQALILGIIQGLAEFLPISSSGHLALTPYVFGWEEPGLAFDVSLHIGTLAAVLWFFKQEWAMLVAAAWNIVKQRGARTEQEKRVLFLILATIPGAVGGILLEDYAETTFRSPILVATMLIIMGIVLWLVDLRARHDRGLGSMRWVDALLIGIAQVCALVPGVSRSGSTITMGRALRFSRESAAVFSFLMSMPITLAAAILKTPEAVTKHGFGLPMAVGIIASALSGWFAIRIMIGLVARRGYGFFAVYRVLIGVAILWLAFTRGS